MSYNFFDRKNKEWDIYANAAREFINLYGIPCKYLPRTNVNIDYLFGEDNALSEFNDFININLYMEDATQFAGGGDVFGPAGLFLDDQITFFVSHQEIVSKLNGEIPISGDLISIFTDDKDIFEVTHVEDKGVLYPFGKNTTFKIFCKKFQYGHEIMNTGIQEIDNMNDLTDISPTASIAVTGSTVTATHQTDIGEDWLDLSDDDDFNPIV